MTDALIFALVAIVSLAAALSSMFGQWGGPHGNPDRKDVE